MIELVAITDGPAPPKGPLRAVRSGGLSVVCRPAEPRDLTPESLWQHEAMLEALMEDHDVLPMRFGTLVADERAAALAIAERRHELAARLDHVRGAVELAVRADARDADPEPRRRGGSGRDYIDAKSHGARAARLLHEPLAAIARDSVTRPGPELLRAAYLVDRGSVDEFVDRVRSLQRDHPRLALLCTGPWPPFSFAEGCSSA